MQTTQRGSAVYTASVYRKISSRLRLKCDVFKMMSGSDGVIRLTRGKRESQIIGLHILVRDLDVLDR